jgi:hypothetical protein
MEIGTIFTLEEYSEAYAYAVKNNCVIEEIEPKDGVRQYQIVAIPEPTVEEKNEAIKQTRASLYAELIDPLHAEKQRKVILGEWTEADEAEYVAEVKRLTQKIQDENPYL